MLLEISLDVDGLVTDLNDGGAEHLLAHADALFYTRYGESIAQVNRTMTDVLQSDDITRWDRLLDEFGEHRAFVDAKTGAERARSTLAAA